MKVSLITVTYNSARFLQNAIQSVYHQNYSNIEYIIVDGGSTDDTLSIIEQNSACITKWVSEKDNGMYDAINKGMKMATGDVIGILNSDDMLASKDVISKIALCFKEQQVDSIFGDLLYVDAEETNRIHRSWKGMPYKRALINTGWMPAHPTFYVRKEVVEQLGGYETHYFSASDFELMTRYLYKYRISSYYLSELIVKMRKGGMSNGSFKKRIRANRRDYLALKENQVPFAFLVSLLKPLRKLPQYIKFLHHTKEKELITSLSPATA
ncbi:MAG: glycosyltransferase [Flavisolibacter sp.]|jgi:glycosyltransferase involved in cell wall biosynthesis|nr:glycosyltransferase [Flavisolibacter sp.]